MMDGSTAVASYRRKLTGPREFRVTAGLPTRDASVHLPVQQAVGHHARLDPEPVGPAFPAPAARHLITRTRQLERPRPARLLGTGSRSPQARGARRAALG